MPKLVQAIADVTVNAAIEVLGTQVRVGILGFLAKNGPATRGQIIKGLSPIGTTTVQNALTVLANHQAITADPPLPSAKSGQRVRYSHNAARIADLHRALGQAAHIA